MEDSGAPAEETAGKAIVVAGVSGCGKSTIGRALAEQLQWTFIEADDFHSPASKAKMAAGEPLDDADRAPWLLTLNKELARQAPAVLACSALKQTYRKSLSAGLRTAFVWIRLDRELAMQRVSGRAGHFMPASLVDSQFDAAETPRDAVFLSASESVATSLHRCTEALAAFIVE